MVKEFPIIKSLDQIANDPLLKLFFTNNDYPDKWKGYNRCNVGVDPPWLGSALKNCTAGALGYEMYLTYYYTGDLDLAKSLQNPGNAGGWFKGWMKNWPRGQEPKVGAVICWSNNSLGHVEVVVKVDKARGKMTIAGSSSQNKHWNYHEVNINGSWLSGMTLQGYIYNPYVVEVEYPKPVERNDNHQVEVKVTNLNLRKSPNGSLWNKYAEVGVYNVLASEMAGDYLWNKIGDDFWIAFNDKWETDYPAEESELERLQKEVNRLIIKVDELEKENASLIAKIEEARKVLE